MIKKIMKKYNLITLRIGMFKKEIEDGKY